ncbi:hypothetical protein D9758_000321 [Tetrapyrgos nigripes]|uniref:Uncharacterized protein n=1 Tax=Tetrapyrgos nigripes TaxID=182062 RepID=A0A8H5H1V6_9AGAR|nr:hypothetical protein D9758_000321 [Tetrapyrgos nigripes]
MASHDVWLDFENLRHSVKHNTVDRLKQILSGLNDECGIHISKSGKKQDIIDRIVQTLDAWKQANAIEKWTKAKAILYQVRNSGTSSSTGKIPSYSAPGSSSSSAGRYDPYAPRKYSGSFGVPATSPVKTATSKQPSLRFKDSPFFRVDDMVSSVVECPESSSSMDRRQQTVLFTLTSQQLDKLKGDNYQLRLFCTSSTFYSNSSLRYNPPCPIEFPPTCEVRVNNVPLTASLKGLKKKPGTAPPPDLGKFVRLNTTQNRVEMIYVNSQQPTQPKKYYLVVQLVETTNVVTLVDGLKRNHFKTCEEIQQQIKASNLEDDDIIAGPQKMSLKCPLTLLRVNTPCRSSKCVHRQCFDATSWFSVMEQTTTWLCPVCEQVLETGDLIIDGFFESILKACPDTVEDVMVEADGEWHTTDNKYGSTAWKIKHPPEKSKPPPPSRKPSFNPIKAATPSSTHGSAFPNGDAKKPAVEITILDDSDDEDEGRVKRELSPSFGKSVSAGASLPPQTQSQEEVIDLTLDSDDDDEPPLRDSLKRKASDAALSPTESIWKKGRLEANQPSSSVSSREAGLSSPVPANSSSATAVRYPSTYHNGPPMPSAFSGTSSFGRNMNGAPQLPPLTRPYPYQSNTTTNGWP